MSYSIKRKYVGKSDLFDSLSLESGKLYSKTLVFFWRTVRKKNLWLKPGLLKKLFNSHKMHAHSADASVESFFNSLKSWRKLRKLNPKARPPKRTKKHFTVTWKNSAIRFKDNNLILSNGRNQKPVILENWKHKVPVLAMLRWTGKEYEIIFTYNHETPELVKKRKIVGVDIGQIHIAACSNGLIVNGRLLRATKQWRHKKLADLNSKIKSKTKGSKRHKKLIKSKKKFLKITKNRSKDILHKLTTGLVATMKRKGVSTLVVGDLTGYRLENDCGKKRNQENHNWSYGEIIWMLKYKAELEGMEVVMQEESYTSQTCPKCGKRKKPKGRNYKCSSCDFSGHRDLVGATNILAKYTGDFGSQLVTEMAPVFGVRYKPHINVAQGFCL